MNDDNDDPENGTITMGDPTLGPRIKNMMKEQYILIDDRVEITTEICIRDIGGRAVIIVDNDKNRHIIHVADSDAAIKVIQMAVLVGNILGKTCEFKER